MDQIEKIQIDFKHFVISVHDFDCNKQKQSYRKTQNMKVDTLSSGNE